MGSGNQRYIETAGTHDITMGDDFINVKTSVGAITLVFPNIRDSGAINTNKVWFVNDVDDMAATNNVTIVAASTNPATELNGGASVVLGTNGFAAEIVPSGYYSYMINSGTGGVQPKIYKALLTQSGTDAPVVSSELVNTLGQTPTYSYVGAGDYRLIVTGGIFVKAKTAMIIAQNIGGGGPIDIIWNSTNDLAIELPSDNILDYTLVLIEVYP